MTVHVVVVTWNGRERTLGCLENVASVRGPERVVHVVDNGSTDGTVEAVAAAYPDARIQALPENAGFAAGANAGMRAALDAGAELVFLLNNDARLADDALELLADAWRRRPECGLYGGRIYRDRARGILWCCGVSLGWTPNVGRLRGHGRRDRGRFLREEPVDALTGCGLLVARTVLERVGLLDEDFFVYVEDADFCARARAAGFQPLYVPGAVLEHPGAGSTGGGYSAARKYLTAHGSVLYLRRHGTPVLWLSFVLCDLLAWPLLWVAGLLTGRLRGVHAKARGLWDGLRGRPADRSVVGAGPVR